jgi:UDP-GlcNAc3NAcA epimerase
MSAVFFEELGIPRPGRFLEVGSGPHGRQTGRMLERLEVVLREVGPDLLLVYGDTNSTLAGALAAAKLHVRVAHVEAGLRSFNRRMPEEINRVLTDHVSDLLFTPTETAVANLAREGIDPAKVHQVGDVMYDVSLRYGALSDQRSDVRARLGLDSRGFALATVHRAENTDDPARLQCLFDGLRLVSRRLPVVLPLHPRTRQLLVGRLAETIADSRVNVIDPLGYLDMLQLEKHARFVLTDSGGVQKEAYFFGVPCVTLRDETEWVELVGAGWNTLWPPVSAPESLVSVLDAYDANPPGERPPFYGDGRAGVAIAGVLSAARS